MKRKLVIAVAAVALCGTLSAAQAGDSLYGAVMGSLVKRDSSLGLDDGYGAAVLIGKPLSERLYWEANLFYSESDVENFAGEIPSLGGGLDLRYALTDGRLQPFLLGGVGGLVDNFKDVGGDKESAPFINLGLGLTSQLGQASALRAELRGYAVQYKRFAGDNTVYDLRFNLGMSFGGSTVASSPAPKPASSPVAAEPAPQPVAAVAAAPAPVVTKPAVVDKFALKDVTFATASDELTTKSRPKLDAVVATLKANPDVKVDIHGYTDSRGEAARNLKLSQRRTESVKKYLVEHGIDAGRLTAVGHGAADPIDTNDTPAGRANNRRVELIAR